MAASKTYRGRAGLGLALLGLALAAYIAIVYLAGVVGLGLAIGVGTHNGWLTLACTAAVAVTFDPVRSRIRRELNRALFGERVTPLEVLAEFSRGVAGGDEALERMARVIADGTGARIAEVWIASGNGFIMAASSPPRTDAMANAPVSRPLADLVVPVRHQGEILGVLAITKNAGDPVTAAEESLLGDVASQAGLALRNVRLGTELAARIEEIAARAEEVRASRRRVVAAQDAERRRLERDIHDGAQQHLVALAVKLRLAATVAQKDPEKALGIFGELEEVTDEAIGNLRDLARGIYPPVLAEHGIVAAIRARAERSTIAVDVETGNLRRYPLAVEAAVYFACLEALQNALKYSSAEKIRINLQETPFGIAFRVSDDGVGFRTEPVRVGSGFVNLTDRIAAIGGTLQVESVPGKGTTVAGEVPAAAVSP